MSKKTGCALVPKVGDEDSKLYKDLLERIKNRPLTNLIYAAYLQKGVAAQLDSLGYYRNKQDQHSAKDVAKFFNVDQMQLEIGKISEVARYSGSRDIHGDLINYTDAKDALNNALYANETYTGTVSYVVQHGDNFNIVTEGKDARTQLRTLEVRQNLQIWDKIEQVFNAAGIDIKTLDFNRKLINANNGVNFVQWMNNIKSIRHDVMSQRDIRTLLELKGDSSQIDRLKAMFGDSLEDVASKMYDALHNSSTYRVSQLDLINSTLDDCQRFDNIDLPALTNDINNIATNAEAEGNEVEIKKILKELDVKYGININEIQREVGNISKLSHAVEEAIFTLNRQLEQIKLNKGVTSEALEIRKTISNLMQEIANKRYYNGVVSFLQTALSQVEVMEKLFEEAVMQTGTNIERAMARSNALQEMDRIRDGYYPIVEALSNIKNLDIDESVSNADLQIMQDKAKYIKEIFDKYKSKIDDLKENNMIDLATEYIGATDGDGNSVANIVQMAKADSNYWDRFYSGSRVSNPLIATMGAITRDAQSKRTQKLNEIATRIRQAHHALNGDTSFMYEKGSNYIISDIDWYAYGAERIAYMKQLAENGVKGIYFTQALEEWEKAHTEDRVVDYTNGRTERVPDANYRKAMPKLTQKQQDYYNTMMQIKGEIGSLLPDYAQMQYLPPQVRRSNGDAFFAAKGNPKKMAKALLNKIKDLWKIREDDETFAKNGQILQGERYGLTIGNMNNTPAQQIPIFYINRLKDQEELLKDFSGALQHLAGTAVNYSCMKEVQGTVEFMGDFIKGQAVSDMDKKGNKTAEKIADNGITVFKQLKKKAAATNTLDIINGFIDEHLYGVKLKDHGPLSKLFLNLINYTSKRSLAVNVKGAISNDLVGELQMIIEAAGGEFFGFRDLLYAHGKVFKNNTAGAAGSLKDYFNNDKNSLQNLITQRFDPQVEGFSKDAHKKYFNNPLRHLLAEDYTFIMYGMGEHLIHQEVMYAVLHNTKVKLNGKKVNLVDVLTKTETVDGNARLTWKEGTTYVNDNGAEVPMDEKFLDKVTNVIRYCNQTCHGSMSEEDRGIMHQRLTGRAILNLRQWMVEHYSRRYRGSHKDMTLGQDVEGYYWTATKFALELMKAAFHFDCEVATQWKDMTKHQKANCRRAAMEWGLWAMLWGLSFAIGEPEDHKKEWWTRMWIYQIKRAILDTKGSTPVGLPAELFTMLNSPIPVAQTIKFSLYPLFGLADIGETVKSGQYKGWNKYVRGIIKYTIPWYAQLNQLWNMDEDDSSFIIFNDGMR
jgi:hypothetical protein